MERAQVGEPGQLVGHRLALDLLVQGRVLDRHHGLAGQVLEQLLLLVREAPPRPRDREDPEELAAPGQRQHRHRERVHGADAGGRRHPRAATARRPRSPGARADHPHARRAPLRGPHRLLELLVTVRRCSRGRRPRRPAGARPASASHASTAVRTARATTPSRSSPIASASPTRRIASVSSPRWRWTSSIFEAELGRHAVELPPELSELVMALDRDRLPEVAAGEAAGRDQEGVDLLGQRAADDARRGERQHQERQQEQADHQAVAGDRVRQLGRAAEDRQLERHALPVAERLDPAPVVLARQAEAVRVAAIPSRLRGPRSRTVPASRRPLRKMPMW